VLGVQDAEIAMSLDDIKIIVVDIAIILAMGAACMIVVQGLRWVLQ